MSKLVHVNCICRRFGKCRCNDVSKAKHLWLENVHDACQTIGEVMSVFGMTNSVILSAMKIIMDSFIFYDEDVTRVDFPPKKILRSKDFICNLGRCTERMTLTEIHLTHSILKRLFKAFYFMTEKYGLPDYTAISKCFHKPECLWVHAAVRTVEVYVKYEGMFRDKQYLIEQRIKCLYKSLYDRVQARIKAFDDMRKLKPRKSCKRRLEDQNSFDLESEECICEENKCHCKLTCKCSNLECLTETCRPGNAYEEYGQGNLDCRWNVMFEKEPCFEMVFNKSEECTGSGESCQCECEYCECIPCEEDFDLPEEEGIEEEDPCSLKRLRPPRIPTPPAPVQKPPPDPCYRLVVEKIKKHDLRRRRRRSRVAEDEGVAGLRRRSRVAEGSDEGSSTSIIVYRWKYVCDCLNKRKPKKKLPCCKICVPRRPRRAKKKTAEPLCYKDEILELPEFDKYLT